MNNLINEIGKKISGYYPGVDSLVALGLRVTENKSAIRLFGAIAIRITEIKDNNIFREYVDRSGNRINLSQHTHAIDLHFFGFDKSWQESLLDSHSHSFEKINKKLSKYFFYKDYLNLINFLKTSDLSDNTPIIVHTNKGFGLLLSNIGFHKSILIPQSPSNDVEMFIKKDNLIKFENKVINLLKALEKDQDIKICNFLKYCLISKLNQLNVINKNKKFRNIRSQLKFEN